MKDVRLCEPQEGLLSSLVLCSLQSAWGCPRCSSPRAPQSTWDTFTWLQLCTGTWWKGKTGLRWGASQGAPQMLFFFSVLCLRQEQLSLHHQREAKQGCACPCI